TRAADHPWAGPDGHQRPGSPRSGTCVCPGARVVPVHRGDPAAFSSAVGSVVFFLSTGGVAGGAGVGRTAPPPGPAYAKFYIPPAGPSRPGADLSLLGSIPLGPYPPGPGAGHL